MQIKNVKNTIKILFLFLLLSGCSQNQVKTHVGSVTGAVSGYATCRGLLNSGIELTAACTVIGAWIGASVFYNDDMNIHTAVFVDTLNTAPGKRSHTNWGNSATGNWGSVTINRSYLVRGLKCTDYESVISISRSWPMSGVTRESEFGTACQLPDGRWKIVETTQ